nr:tumor necrosis factor receptor superfamily member 10D-like [Aotus nancymaae]
MAPGPETLLFAIVLFVVQLLDQGAPAPIARQDEVPQRTVTPQQQTRSLKEKECSPGFHRPEYNGACKECTEGVDYTNTSNNLSSCIQCTVCKSGQKTKSLCTRTTDTVCQCEEGTFQDENSPEMCRKSGTGHLNMVLENNTRINKSAANSTEKTPVLRTTTWWTLFACCLILIVFIVGIILAICCVRFWLYCSRGPKTDDNAHNEILNNRDLQPTQVPEQEIEDQELAGLIGVTVQSPEEPQCLLGQAEAEGCQRRRLQVPVNDADPTEINTLLDASATLEEGHAKETIQDQLVGAEKLLCEEGDGGSATSYL